MEPTCSKPPYMDIWIASPEAASSRRADTDSLSSHATATGVPSMRICMFVSPRSRFSDSAQARMSSAVLPLSMRFTSRQAAVSPVSARRFSALEPAPLEPEVQNGRMVLPDTSMPSSSVYRIFGACPCQMG